MLKTPDKRQKSGADFAAELTRVHQRLREQNARIDQQAQFDVLRRLRFFHEFSHAEIWEVLRASTMTDYPAGEEIVKEGEMDDRFYILVNGKCTVERHGKTLGSMDSGDCFGETSYVRGARRTATIRAETAGLGAARRARRCWSRCPPPASCASTACSCARWCRASRAMNPHPNHSLLKRLSRN